MPRQARIAPGGLVYHVLNRAVARLPLLIQANDYDDHRNELRPLFFDFGPILLGLHVRQPTTQFV